MFHGAMILLAQLLALFYMCSSSPVSTGSLRSSSTDGPTSQIEHKPGAIVFETDGSLNLPTASVVRNTSSTADRIGAQGSSGSNYYPDANFPIGNSKPSTFEGAVNSGLTHQTSNYNSPNYNPSQSSGQNYPTQNSGQNYASEKYGVQHSGIINSAHNNPALNQPIPNSGYTPSGNHGVKYGGAGNAGPTYPTASYAPHQPSPNSGQNYSPGNPVANQFSSNYGPGSGNINQPTAGSAPNYLATNSGYNYGSSNTNSGPNYAGESTRPVSNPANQFERPGNSNTGSSFTVPLTSNQYNEGQNGESSKYPSNGALPGQLTSGPVYSGPESSEPSYQFSKPSKPADSAPSYQFERPSNLGSHPAEHVSPPLTGDSAAAKCECVASTQCPLLNTRIVTPDEEPCVRPGDIRCCLSEFPNMTPPHCGIRPNISLTGVAISPGQARFGEHPWSAVLLNPENEFVGGGALLDERHVLTAAHKVAAHVNDLRGLKVRLGEWDAAGSHEPYAHEEFAVSHVHIYPEFNAKNLRGDVAVVTLERAVELRRSPHIATACLPQQDTLFTGHRCWVAGWGQDGFGTQGAYQNVLKQVDVPVVDADECEARLRDTKLSQYFQLDRRSFMCAGGEIQKDACTGDGGSPLVCENLQQGQFYVAGLVAWGIGCATRGVPGVYVNVAGFSNWIAQQIADFKH